jgi:hypothetical protein
LRRVYSVTIRRVAIRRPQDARTTVLRGLFDGQWLLAAFPAPPTRPAGNLGDCRSAATRRLLNGRPGHAGAQSAGECSRFFRPAAVSASRLSTTAVLVVLAGDRGEHIEHYGIEGGKHAGRELVARRRKLPACRKVERDTADLPRLKLSPELTPIRVRQARKPVNLLD